MIIDTFLDIAHLELIKIFIKANELTGVEVIEYPVELRGRHHMCIRLESTYEDSSAALTYLGFRHMGVKNMFDDYLIRCGVAPYDLNPNSYHTQLRHEREIEQNEKFTEHLKTVFQKKEL